MSNRQAFLSGENTNLVVQQIVNGLNKYGMDIDIKGLQSKIINFMARVEKEYPQSDIKSLNNFVINKCVEKYMNNQPQFNQTQGNGKDQLSSQFERELASRGYAQVTAPQLPERPDFSQPINGPFNQIPQQNNRHGLSLNQARGQPEPDLDPPAPVLPQAQIPEPVMQEPVESRREVIHHYNNSHNHTTNEIILSLNKNDLINVTGNTYTFSWNRKIVNNFGGNFQVKLQYVTIPKRLPYLLVKYHSSDKETNRVFSATGKNYSAKLIPSHTSDEYTTYQALGDNSVNYEDLPHNLTFQLIPPEQNLDLNIVPVQKVTKNKSQIHIITKYPHSLTSNDSLVLEFPQQKTCYKVNNLQIIDSQQILVDSPFVGYFSSDFKLLRSNWNIDLTVFCQYN